MKQKPKPWEMLEVTMKDDPLLCVVMMQLVGICWAISMVRQLEFLCKKLKKMDLNDHLSIQDFVDRIPKEHGNFDVLYSDGGTKDGECCLHYLQEFGTLLESQLPLDNRVDVTISSLCVYSPTHYELAKPIPINGHYLLAIGCGLDRNFGNRLFYQCQESQGSDFAAEGYSYIYADLVTTYVDMDVGQNPHY